MLSCITALQQTNALGISFVQASKVFVPPRQKCKLHRNPPSLAWQDVDAFSSIPTNSGERQPLSALAQVPSRGIASETRAPLALQRIGPLLTCGIQARRVRALVLAWLQCSTVSLKTTWPTCQSLIGRLRANT